MAGFACSSHICTNIIFPTDQEEEMWTFATRQIGVCTAYAGTEEGFHFRVKESSVRLRISGLSQIVLGLTLDLYWSSFFFGGFLTSTSAESYQINRTLSFSDRMSARTVNIRIKHLPHEMSFLIVFTLAYTSPGVAKSVADMVGSLIPYSLLALTRNI